MQDASHIHRVPNEVLLHIFSFTDPLNVSQVCRRFRGLSSEIQVPPFKSKELADFLITESKASMLHIRPEKTAPVEDCQCAKISSSCNCAQKAYFYTLFPLYLRWHTLDLGVLWPELCAHVLRQIAGIELTSTRPAPRGLPALCRVRVPHIAMQVLEMINPDLMELIYTDDHADKRPPRSRWSNGELWTFSDLVSRLGRFPNLRKMTFEMGYTNLDDVSMVQTIELPMLRSLSIRARHTLTNTPLTHILHIIHAPQITSLNIRIYRAVWDNFHYDDMFWNDVSMFQNLTHLTIDNSFDDIKIGPKIIVTKVLAHCASLVELTVKCANPEEDFFNPSRTFEPDPNEVWNMHCPLRRLYLLDCYEYREDLISIGENLRSSSNWDNFEKVVLDHNRERIARDADFHKIMLKLHGKKEDPEEKERQKLELEEFLMNFREEMEEKVEWTL